MKKMATLSLNARTRGHAPARLAFTLTLALLLLVGLLGIAARTASADIKLIDLDPYRGTGTSGDAYREGFMAAFDGKTVGTESITFIPRAVGEALSDIDTILTRVLASDPDVLAVTGTIGIQPVNAMIASIVATDNNLVSIGASSSYIRSTDFSRNVFFYDVNMATQGVALLDLATRLLQVRTHVLFYSTDVGDLEVLIPIFDQTVEAAGQPFAAMYGHASSEAFSAEKTEALIATLPQVIYLYADADAVLTKFLRTVLSDNRTARAKILTVDSMQPYFESILPTFKSQYGIELEDGQIILTSSTASSTDTDRQHVRQFHQEMKAYIDAGSSTIFTDSTILTTDPTVATKMLAGWVEGIATLTTIQTSPGLDNRSEFQDSLFRQRRIAAAGDLLYGTFSDTCTAIMVKTGWSCECNQGGRSIYYHQLDSTGMITDNLASLDDYTYDADICLVTDANPRFSFSNGVAFNFTDASLDKLQYITGAFQDLYESADPAVVSVTNSVVIQTTRDTLQADYDAYFATHKVDMVIGLVPDPNFDTRGAVLANPIPYRPAVREPDALAFYIAPTCKQQIYLFYMFLGSKSTNVHHPITGTHVNVILKDIIPNDTDNFTQFFTQSAATADIPDPIIHSIDASTAATSKMSTKGYNYVIGISFEDAEPIVNFLAQNTGAVVVLLYDDFATYYSELMRAISATPTSVQARLLSMTNFPLWSDTSAEAEEESTLLAAFHSVHNSTDDYTPRNLCIFVTTLVLADIMNAVRGNILTATTIASGVYRDTYRNAADLRVGPFTTCNASLDDTIRTDGSCTDRNYGAFEVSVLSAQRALDPTQPANMMPTEPSLVYKPRPKHLSKGAIAGIIVGSVAAVGIIVAIIVVFCCCLRKNARDNRNAPKDPNEPVTMIFTDIESSTALWAHIPTIMPDAVAKHHSVIRGVIATYKCYEVKTIGDSFMIACKDATTAAQLSCALQVALLAADYGTTEIDDAYREMELQREADDDEQVYKAHTAHLPEDAYASMWGGLRVRMGVHTGACEVRYDEVSKGYDYYGETVNMAARTEAIGNGGQVIFTEATWSALSDDVRGDLHHTELGPVGLRGVPHAVSMFQVDAIAGRRFAPLRTEIEAALPDEATEITSSAMATSASMNVASILVSNILKTLTAPFRPAQRAKEMKPLLARWGIPVPNKPASVTVDDYNTFLTNRLAIKVSAVYQRAHGRTQGSAELPSYAASNRTTDLVQIALNQLPSRRATGDGGFDRADASLPRVFVDEANGSVHDVRRGSRSFVRRLAARLSARDNSVPESDKYVHVGATGHNRSAHTNITFVSDYSAASTVDVPSIGPLAGIRVHDSDEKPGEELYQVPGSVEMPESHTQHAKAPAASSFATVVVANPTGNTAQSDTAHLYSPFVAGTSPASTPTKRSA